MIRLHRATILVAATSVGLACDSEPITVVAEVDETYGFETGAEGWTEFARTGPGGVASATVSSQQASDGSASMRLSLDDATGDGEVYVTRRFTGLAESRAYDVDIAFDLGSADTSPPEAWTLRAGVEADEPDGGAVFQGVGSTAVAGSGVTFEPRTATLTGSTGPDGVLWITVGVVQDTPGERDYYLDDLRVTLTRR